MESPKNNPGEAPKNQTVQCTVDDCTLYSPSAEVIEKRSQRLCHIVNWIFTRQIRKGFHSCQLYNRPNREIEGPLVVYLNHPSWNDPMVISLLHYHFFPEREAYGPIDAEALEGYKFFTKIGLYGVTHGNAGGARQFLRSSLAIIHRQSTAIWITAQGKFSDARERPVVIESGLPAVLKAAKVPVTVLPLALEYTYGEEKLPEIFVNFGKPIAAPQENTTSAWKTTCEQALEATQDELAARVIAKDTADFETVLGGKVGVGGFYGFWSRLKAIVTGKKYNPSHGSLTNKS